MNHNLEELLCEPLGEDTLNTSWGHRQRLRFPSRSRCVSSQGGSELWSYLISEGSPARRFGTGGRGVCFGRAVSVVGTLKVACNF